MSGYRIVSDGSCDLPAAVAEKRNIEVVPFYVSFDDMNYMKEGVDISVRDFYQRMVDNKGVFPKSSLPSVHDYVTCFENIVKQGEGVVCICITTKFSGSCQAAMNAKDIVLEDYPDARIAVINSKVDTVLQGLFVLEAADMRDAGVSMEECVKELESVRDTGRIFFTIGSIDYLQHGGRIGKLSSLAASVLGIKPLITLKEGEIFSSGISRNRKASLVKTIGLLKQHIADNNIDIKDYRICVGFGYDYDESVAFRKSLLESLDGAVSEDDCPIYQIGATIAVHTGPYPLGIGFLKKPSVI